MNINLAGPSWTIMMWEMNNIQIHLSSVPAITCMVLPTTIGYTLIGQQGSLASTKNIVTVSGTMAYVSTT